MASGDLITGDIPVNFMLWSGNDKAPAGHLLVRDSGNNTLWDTYCDVADKTDVLPLKNVVGGIRVTSMPQGKLFVYLAPHGRPDFSW